MKYSKRLLALLLSVVMLLGLLPAGVLAAGTQEDWDKVLTVVSTKESTLAPGVTHSNNVAYAADGGMIRYYVAKADMTRDDLMIQTSYYNAQCETWGLQKMSDQVAALKAKHTNPDDPENYIENYAPVVGIDMSPWNTQTNVPAGAFVMNGYMLRETAEKRAWFGVWDDGTILCGAGNADYAAAIAEHGTPAQALGGFQLLLKNGERMKPGTLDAGDNRPTYTQVGSRYPSAFVGVTAAGEIVFLCVDGKGAGGSVGADYNEAVTLLEMQGCIYAMSCDGGGSASYVYRPEGESDVIVGNNPADGAEREVATGMVISTLVPPSNVFARATLTPEHEYVTPYSAVKFAAEGVSPAGTAAEIPADVSWTLADESFGTVENGVFTSNGKLGTATVQMVYEGKVVGSEVVHIVNPTAVDFNLPTMVLPYGKFTDLVINGIYTDVADRVVAVKASDFDFSFSTETKGSLEGLRFTAPSDETETGVVITATYKYATLPAFSVDVTFGKGSEILYDFEDGDISHWKGTEDAYKWSKENDVHNALSDILDGIGAGNSLDGQFVESVDSNTFLADRETGEVKNGDYALGVTLDNRYDIGAGGWVYNMFFNVAGTIVLRDTAKGKNATTFGTWIYLPEGIADKINQGDAGYAMQVQLVAGNYNENGELVNVGMTMNQAHMYRQDTKGHLYGSTSVPEAGWVYFTVDLSPFDYVATYANDTNVAREPCFIRFYTKRFEPAFTTLYFDDMTLDYSSAVDDRDAPIISNPTFTSNNIFDNAPFTTVCPDNRVSFFANIADKAASNASGLDYSSAKIYVDGVALEGVTASGNTMGTSNAVALTGGQHTVTFEIADNMGTMTMLSQTLTINAGTSPITLTGHNDLGNTPAYDSVYYADIKVADIATVESVSFDIKLNTANSWELDHMTAAKGFTATYSVNPHSNIATINVAKTGECDLTGEQILVSMPVRVYSWDDEASGRVNGPDPGRDGSMPIVMIRLDIKRGLAVLNDEAYADTLVTFGHDLTVDTTIDDIDIKQAANVEKVHLNHTVTAVADMAATCTTAGFTGRTYCHVCGSIVEWGTTIEATGHTYAIVDGVLKCSCGETFTGVWTDGKEYVNGIVIADGWNGESYYVDGLKVTGNQLIDGVYYGFDAEGITTGKINGIFDYEGNTYYAINGELKSGWMALDDGWYYFDTTTYIAADGTQTAASCGLQGYNFNYVFANGKLTEDVWYSNSALGTRLFYGPAAYSKCFVENNGKEYYFDTNCVMVTGIQILKTSPWSNPTIEVFDDNGVYQGRYETTGVVKAANGQLYYSVEGTVGHGLRYFEGDYYFFHRSDFYALSGEQYVPTFMTNDLLAPNTYEFGADYKMLQGVVEKEDGNYFYKNGHPAKNGVVSWNGELYYVGQGGKLASGRIYVGTSASNGLLNIGYYEFGADNKLLNGIIEKEDGKYYYSNGVATRAYLMEIDGEFYYAGTNGKLITNATIYIGTEAANGLVAPRNYEFDAEGKMIYTGIYEKEDGLYYYVNGVATRAYLIEIDGEFYYADTNGKLVTNQSFYVGTYPGHGWVAPRYYEFDAEGKMLYTGIYEKEDGLYYYVEGVPTRAYLMEIDGEYYFASTGGKLITNQTFYVGTYPGHGWVAPRNYEFDAEGKMLYTGIYEKEDGLYYYVEGVPTRAYLMEIDGEYYFASTGGKLITNQTFYVGTYPGHGWVAPRNYEFDAEGKMIYNGIYEKEDGLYYYVEGVPTRAYLMEIDGEFYYVGNGGKLVMNERIYVGTSAANGLVAPYYYEFDAEGKMIYNGIHEKEDGLYYYVNGVPTRAYVIEIDGFFYYVGNDGKLVTNEERFYIGTYTSNDLLPWGYYSIDANGRITAKVK